MDKEFKDITITGVDEKKTLENKISEGKYRVHLKLSENAPAEWCRLFEVGWNRPTYSMWRRAEVYPRHIVIECPIDEIERYHKEPLKEVVEAVNVLYRQHLAQMSAEEERQRQEDEAGTKRAKEQLGKIKF